jgi:hypothetical protein
MNDRGVLPSGDWRKYYDIDMEQVYGYLRTPGDKILDGVGYHIEL